MSDNSKVLKSLLMALREEGELIKGADIRTSRDKMPGGKADTKSPSDFDSAQLRAGIKVELEHTKDHSKAQEIAMDHLAEDPDYYKDWDAKEKILFKPKAPKLEKALEDLEKGRKALPIGTTRTWGGQDYIKRADGWAAVGGKNDGKVMGKFKESSSKTAPTKAVPTPEETASAETDRLEAEGEYANARDSKVSNLGEDLKGSARHKAMRWKGLAAAEADGTADKLITRSMLLKNEPPDLITQVNKDNFLMGLVLHEALKKFPPKPSGGDSTSSAEVSRKQYLDAYMSIKTKTEEVIHTHSMDLEGGIKEVRTHVRDLIAEYRKEAPYSQTANQLAKFHNNALGSSRKRSSAAGSVNSMLSQYARSNNLDSMEVALGGSGVFEAAKKVMEGVSPEKAFSLEKKEGPKKFSATEMYVDTAVRVGPETKLKSMKSQSEYLLKSAEIRGIQWGNSVTDGEREHHLKYVAESFKDLTDILELPEQMGSFNGKLGLAIGARGRGTALAHYEPGTNVINLTRKGGVGSLAHEWGHFFDKTLSDTHGRAGRTFLSEGAYSFPDSEVAQAMNELVKSEAWQEHTEGTKKTLKAMAELGIHEKNSYWGSTRELFARAFERHVQHKLLEKGRENTYLSGIGSIKKDDPGHGFWPNKALTEKLAPHFDKVFEKFRNSEHLKKAMSLGIESLLHKLSS